MFQRVLCANANVTRNNENKRGGGGLEGIGRQRSNHEVNNAFSFYLYKK